MNDDDGALGGCVYVAFHDPAAHGESFAEASIVSSGTTLAPPRWAKLIGQPRSRRLRRRITLRRQLPDGGSHQRACQRAQNERARPQPNLEDVVGDNGRISLLLDDRVTHAGVPSGEYGCCPK